MVRRAACPQDVLMAPNDRERREELVLSHFGLARRLARRYAHGDPDLLEELEQVAALGLVQAAGRYDPTRGTAFSTFAVPTIVGELRRHFRTNRWAVHVPRRLQEAYLQARDAERAFTARHGRVPGAAELAEGLGWALDDLLEARAAAEALSPTSLTQPIGSDPDAPTLAERVGTEDPGFRLSELRDELDQAMAQLEPPAGQAVRLRFGAELTYGEIASRLSVSPSHASSLVGRALGEIGAAMLAEGARSGSRPIRRQCHLR
jgi:RNA polymerase sigma-B factor